jgi:hypothetical protein
LKGAVDVAGWTPNSTRTTTLNTSAMTRRWRDRSAPGGTGDDVVVADEGSEQPKIADVELAVAVHEHDVVAG